MFNFKDFEKVAEDKQTTTMKHKDGHTITLHTKSLPPIQREQLKRLKMSKGGEVAHYDQGTPNNPVSQDDASSQTHNGSPITINVGAPQQESSRQVVAPQAPQVLPSAPQDNRILAPTQVSGPTSNLMSSDQTTNLPAAVKQQAQAANMQANISGQQAKAAVPVEQEAVQKLEAIQQNNVHNYNELAEHAKDFSDYAANNKINPNAFTENMGAGQKTATASALFLGGLGGAFTHQSNPALDYLNKQIDRDIQGQKDRMGQEQTIYGAYERLYGDATLANNMTKVSMNDILTHKMSEIAAKLGTQQALQKAMEFKAQKAIENNQLLIDSSARLGTLRTSTNQPQQGQNGQSGHGAMNATTSGLNKDEAAGSVLHPGAEQMYEGLKYNPVWKDRLPEITKQYTQAQQADKNLSSIDKTFNDMVGETNGLTGRLHRSINPHAVAAIGAGLGTLIGRSTVGGGVGAAIGEGAGQLIKGATNTSENRSYDSDKTALANHITAALKGTPVPAEIIQKAVDDNAPETGDTPETLAKKLKNIKMTIKNNVETSLLKATHLTNE